MWLLSSQLLFLQVGVGVKANWHDDVDPNILGSEDDNLAYNNNVWTLCYLSAPIKATLSFWRS
jgi:hypothetical protein